MRLIQIQIVDLIRFDNLIQVLSYLIDTNHLRPELFPPKNKKINQKHIRDDDDDRDLIEWSGFFLF